MARLYRSNRDRLQDEDDRFVVSLHHGQLLYELDPLMHTAASRVSPPDSLPVKLLLLLLLLLQKMV